MKKLLSIVLALTLVLTLAACGSETNNAVESNNDVSSVETSNDVGNSAENNEEAPAETSTDAEWKMCIRDRTLPARFCPLPARPLKARARRRTGLKGFLKLRPLFPPQP